MIPVSVDEVAFVRSDTLSGAWFTRPSELDAPEAPAGITISASSGSQKAKIAAIRNPHPSPLSRK